MKQREGKQILEPDVNHVFGPLCKPQARYAIGVFLRGGGFLPGCGRKCASFATHLSGPVPARNSGPCRTATAKTLSKGLRPLAPASHSPIFRASLVQTSARPHDRP